MATWLQLWDVTKKQNVWLVNTHFDHRGRTARLESAQLIRQFVNKLPFEPQFIVVTGDFNAAESSPPYQALFASETNSS